MAFSLGSHFPFLAAYWQPVLLAALAAAVVHLLLERRRARTAAARPAPWRDESVSESAVDPAPPPPAEKTAARVPYRPARLGADEMVRRAEQFYRELNGRRSVRHFSREPVPRAAVEAAIRAAGTAPSGAHTEPWTFVLVESAEVKAAVRQIVEDEERVNYEKRMGAQWVQDLAPIGTDWRKEYLTEVPFLVLAFRHAYGVDERGERFTTYYNEISCHLACGLLLAALHQAGLATLTSTPLNCGPRLRRLLARPDNEKLVLLLPVGLPAADCTVPDFRRKPLDKIMAVC
ncbi:iodotyrosine deiodinase 1-like [Amphibalanus amphitrite]|uniref:iodotyrosine deiodinase 1-like n=1 Tax=Amphibalanus amphitrite TaxID=1232801 RepID=UPI001C90A302|nr:iodotyrosine deiodinase 1-like [Amphibalanus amphitrite]